MSRVCIIGLDCLSPVLCFERYAHRMPNLHKLVERGFGTLLRSCDPPITVPAWTCMVTGADPGTLGIYGFSDRADHSYDNTRLASSLDVTKPPLWTLLSRAGLRCTVIGVPQTYPPKPINGKLVAGCLTPNTDYPFTYPPSLAAEVQELSGGYIIDIEGFRQRPRQQLLNDILAMTDARFRLAEAWIAENDWDFFMMVDMGPDRMHHGFWRFMAPDHPAFVPNHPFSSAIEDYYARLDDRLGRMFSHLRGDDVILVVSDHGAQTMQGAIAINDWLIANGYLSMRKTPTPEQPASLQSQHVDWQHTTAWAKGGYVARLYLNIKGREPQGRLNSDEAAALRLELTKKLRSLQGPRGENLDTRVLEPRKLYPRVTAIAPDLLVYFDNLSYRAAATWGHSQLFLKENDTGPDDANHAEHGLIVAAGSGIATSAPSSETTLFDIAPTVLEHFKLPIPPYALGRSLKD